MNTEQQNGNGPGSAIETLRAIVFAFAIVVAIGTWVCGVPVYVAIGLVACGAILAGSI